MKLFYSIQQKSKLPGELVGKSCADHLFLAHQNQFHQPQMEVAHHQLRRPFHYSPC